MMRTGSNFIQDRKGIAAIEFSLIFPLFLFLLAGSFEITNAVIAHKKTQKIAYTLDHLMAKSSTLNANTVQRIMGSTSSVLAPLDPSRLTIELSYQYIDDKGAVSDRWEQKMTGGKSQKAEKRALPTAFAKIHNAAYLYTRVDYVHRATFPSLFFKEYAMHAESILRPRPGAPLKCDDC